MRRVTLLILILLSISVVAEDKTPYSFCLGGNVYVTGRDVSVTFLAERYDIFIVDGDNPHLFDSIYDTCMSWDPVKYIRYGPYFSSQELSLYVKLQPTLTYDYRLTLLQNRYVAYAEHWMDSIKDSLINISSADSVLYDRESLYVHLADSALNITQEGDGNRDLHEIDTLPHRKKRFTYQYWNNDASDTGMYPNGYTWLANGFNENARLALAYSYKRILIEDSAHYYPARRASAYFADNQYRGGYAPRLYSYYDINSTSGGPTAGMDWFEVSDIETNTDSLDRYYDSSTLPIDRTVDSVLNAECAAMGAPDSIIRFANVNKTDNTALLTQIPTTSVVFENVMDVTGKNWREWRQMMYNAWTLQDWNDSTGGKRRFCIWECRMNGQVSDNPADWNYDSARVYYAGYCCFLNFQSENQYICPTAWDRSQFWIDAYHVDLGDRIGKHCDSIAIDGSCDVWGYGTCRHVLQTKYINNNDTGIALFMYAYSPSDPGITASPVTYDLEGWYYKIDENGDTALTPDSTIQLYSAMGYIGIQGDPVEMAPNIYDFQSSKDTVYIQTTFTATVTDDYGIDTVRLFVYLPDSTPWIHDSISVLDTVLGADVLSYPLSETYTWTVTGAHWTYLHVTDDSTNTKVDSIQTTVQESEELIPVTINKGYRNKGAIHP